MSSLFVKNLEKEYSNFVKKIYSRSESLKIFQQKLLNILSWDSKEMEYRCKKNCKESLFQDYNTEIDSLKDLVQSVYTDEIIIPKPISFVEFWFKCLKKIIKFYYKNPMVFKDDNDYRESKNYIQECIRQNINKVSNITSIVKYKLQQIQDVPSQDEKLIHYIEISEDKDESGSEKLNIVI
jgi:hypothetical protein